MTWWQDCWFVASCPHPAFLEAEPDAFGDQTCVRCETRVRTVLTELAFKTTANACTPGVFPDVD